MLKDLENKNEVYLVEQVAAIGGICWKFVSPGTKGVPDRVILYRGHAYFIELKRDGEEPSAMQRHCVDQINKAGVYATYLDCKEDIDAFIRAISLSSKSD